MNASFSVGDWSVDPSVGTVSRGDESHTLEPKVMAVLVYLARHEGEVLSKDRLLQAVWPDTFVTEDVLRRAVFEIRKSLGDDSSQPRYIRTLTRRGFQLIAEVVFPEEKEEESKERFQVLRPLGKGVMAEVHLARDTTLGRKVALKFLLNEIQEEEQEEAWSRRLRTYRQGTGPVRFVL